MTNERIFQIERFYFGTLIQEGQPIGTPGVVGATPGVTPGQIQECLRLARVTPPPPDQTSADMPATLGFFRGQSAEHFILLKAQRTPEGYPQLLYVMLPEIVLRWLGGNLTLFQQIGAEPMPAFEVPRRDLPTLTIENPEPLSDSAQIDLLYDFFQYCGDKIKNVEGLTAALINNLPIAILNAPASLDKRLRFLQGLLALLPAPARVGLTWATSVEKPDETQAQIKFLAQATSPAGHFIFDWATGEMLSEAPADKYSKFIASQLRLDASQVVETTASIAKTALWRAMRKDSLAQALYVASRRAQVDSAVQNNQPAERDIVAAILRQDPTLADDLRVSYAQHLLAFTLVLDDQPEHADVVPLVAAANRPVAEASYRQMRAAAENDHPGKALELVERWLVNVPQASALPWYQIGHIAALKQLDKLLTASKVPETMTFVRRLLQADERLQLNSIVPRIIATVQASPAFNPQLALMNFLLAAQYLTSSSFQQTVSDPQHLKQLPKRLQQAILFLQPDKKPDPPPGLLVSAAAELAPEFRMQVVGRLAEWAIQVHRTELLDNRAIEIILRATQSGYSQHFETLIEYLAKEFNQPHKIAALDPSALDTLPLLYFLTKRYDAGVHLLEIYQFSIFTVEKLAAFNETVGKVFLKLRLPLAELEKIFEIVERSRLRPEPRVRALGAVLMGVEWKQGYRSLANRLIAMLFKDSALLKVIGTENGLRLLSFFGESKDATPTMQTGLVLLDAAIAAQEKGVELMGKVWDSLRSYPSLAGVAIELMRRYVRQAAPEIAPRLPAIFEKRLGHGLGEKLEATYLIRTLLGDQDLLELNTALDFTTKLLIDIGTTYYAGKERPPGWRLRDGLDVLSGGLEDADRTTIANNLEFMARAIFTLGTQKHPGRKPNDLNGLLLRNDFMPQTGLEALIFLGGRFANHKVQTVDLSRAAPAVLLGYRNATMLLRESGIAARFFGNLLKAFPPDKPIPVSLQSFNEELDSLWQYMSLYNQRQVKQPLGENCQYTAQIITLMADGVKEKIFKDKNLDQGKTSPENGLEALRWVAGYFNRTHVKP